MLEQLIIVVKLNTSFTISYFIVDFCQYKAGCDEHCVLNAWIIDMSYVFVCLASLPISESCTSEWEYLNIADFVGSLQCVSWQVLKALWRQQKAQWCAWSRIVHIMWYYQRAKAQSVLKPRHKELQLIKSTSKCTYNRLVNIKTERAFIWLI